MTCFADNEINLIRKTVGEDGATTDGTMAEGGQSWRSIGNTRVETSVSRVAGCGVQEHTRTSRSE